MTKKFHLGWFMNFIPPEWDTPWASPDVGKWPNGRFYVDMAKSLDSNRNGVPGLTAMAVRFSEQEDTIRRDCGMHGGLGAYETQPTLIAVGRGFVAGVSVTKTSRIIDIAPTALAHLDLPLDEVDGTALQK